jgi:phosphomannomutase
LPDLSFGTAGLRAEMGVGFNRMNVVTVRLATMVKKRKRKYITIYLLIILSSYIRELLRI